MMDVRANDGWANRLGSTARYTLIVMAAILGLFAVAMLAGFSYVLIEDPHLPTRPLAYIMFAAMVGLVALFGWLLAKLIRSIRPETMSGFDRRYWKMWAVIMALSLPLGIALGTFGLSEQGGGLSGLLSNAPIAPLTAIVAALLLTAVLGFAAIYYHRTVDDHEERAYLWGSTIAFYFLAFSFPLYWLLARGGLVPQLTIGIALLIILLSCIVQAVVWALFKFR